MAFAQEVRDFLAGYKTVSEVVQGNERGKLGRETLEADKEYKAAVLALRGEELDLQRQRLSQSAAGAGRAAEAAAIRMQRDTERHAAWQEDREYELAQRAGAAAEAEAAAEADRFGPLGETPPGQIGALPTTDPFEGIVPAMAEGGLVSRLKSSIMGEPEGQPPALPTGVGPIRSDSRPIMRADPPPTALPTGAPAPAPLARPAQPPSTAAQVDPSRPAGTTSPTRNEVNPEAIHIVASRGQQAARDGLRAIEKSFSVPRSALNTANADPLAPEISMQELEAMRETVDPNGSMPANLRALATMAEAYNYFVEKNEPEKAANAAKHYILAERRASQTQGVLAMNALKEGNVVQACQLINNACERFPTAHEISVTPGEDGMVNYSVKEAGKVLEQGRVSANELMEITGQIADGSLFMQSLVGFVASTEPEGGQPSQALNAFSSAYSAAAQAQTAFDESRADGGEGDPALRAAAEAARGRVEETRAKALDLGLSMSDLSAAVRTDENLAAPGAPTPAPGDTPQGNIPAPTTRQEYDALPSGTRYRHPNGEIKVKP